MGKITIPGKDVPKNREKGRGLNSLMHSQDEEIQPVNQITSYPDKQITEKIPYRSNPEFKLSAFYINKALLAKIHALSITESKELSKLANEAFEDLLTKYKV